MKKPKTRAQLTGLNAKALYNKALRFTAQAHERLQQIAYDWNELTSTVDSAATDLERALDEFDKAMREALDYANEPPEEAE